MKKVFSVLVIIGATLLAGCNDAPTQTDVEKLFNESAKEANDAVRAVSPNYADQMLTTIHSVKLNSCDEVENGDYSCTIKSDITAPLIGRKVTTKPFTFRKKNDEWTVVL